MNHFDALANAQTEPGFEVLRDAALQHLDDAYDDYGEADEAHDRALVLAVLALADAIRNPAGAR